MNFLIGMLVYFINLTIVFVFGWCVGFIVTPFVNEVELFGLSIPQFFAVALLLSFMIKFLYQPFRLTYEMPEDTQ